MLAWIADKKKNILVVTESCWMCLGCISSSSCSLYFSPPLNIIVTFHQWIESCSTQFWGLSIWSVNAISYQECEFLTPITKTDIVWRKVIFWFLIWIDVLDGHFVCALHMYSASSCTFEYLSCTQQRQQPQPQQAQISTLKVVGYLCSMEFVIDSKQGNNNTGASGLRFSFCCQGQTCGDLGKSTIACRE